MNIIKKQGLGAWICLAAIVLTLIGFILYTVAVSAGNNLVIASGSDMFYDMTRPEDVEMGPKVVTFSIAAIVLLAASLILGQLDLKGGLGKVCTALAGLFRIAAPALILVAVLYFVYGSFTGLGWTFFSNAELAIYPEATAVGNQVITGVVFFVLAMLASIVAAFFEVRNKND